MFSYVDIKTEHCEGWLNLFFDDYCVALVNNVHIANKIREEIEPKYAKPCEHCGAIYPVGHERDHQCPS